MPRWLLVKSNASGDDETISMALKSLICKKKVDGGHATASWIVCLFLRFKTPLANPAWL